MRNEHFIRSLESAEDNREKHQELPQVSLYDLSDTRGRRALHHAVKQYPGNRGILPSFSGERALKRAQERDIFVNNFQRHLVDRAKLHYPPGYFAGREEELNDYVRRNDKAENSVVAEFSWKSEGRFVRLPREEDFYQIVTSRETLIIPEDVQDKLRKTKIAIAGMGVGASIGHLLVQSGAQHLTVADGGAVDLHDFNRYPHSDVSKIGQNHAVDFTKFAYETNPYADITCYPENVGTEEKPGIVPIHKLLADADIVIEEVDNLPMKLAIRHAAKEAGIPVVMGTDIGKSAVVHFEYPNDEPFGGNLLPSDIDSFQQRLHFEEITELAIKVIGERNIPDNLLRRANQIGLPYWPQDGGAARKSAAGVRDAITDYLKGEVVPKEKVLP
jgi:hypothetical protein